MEDAAQHDIPDDVGEELAAMMEDAAGRAPEVAPEPEAMAIVPVVRENDPICVICQQDLRPAPPLEQHDLEALACGHVHHKVCLERWWSIRDIARGRCPICQVDPQAGQQQLERLLGEVVAAEPQPDVLV